NLRYAMILGCVLVALILVAFLFEWRTAVISLTAIPLSIVSAIVVLNLLGGTINTMVLAGLAIAIGEVVDDAIIDVENVVRRLLPVGLKRPVLAVGTLALLFVAAAWLYPQLKEEYLPRFQESDFLMHWVAKPGTGIDVMRRDIVTVSREMRQEKAVAEFG